MIETLTRQKLIEGALTLNAITAACARDELSIASGRNARC